MPSRNIDRLTLRMPDVEPSEAERLALLVAEGLAAWPVAASGQVGRLDVRVEARPGDEPAALARAIVAALVRQLDHLA
jgi:hypothetical protein